MARATEIASIVGAGAAGAAAGVWMIGGSPLLIVPVVAVVGVVSAIATGVRQRRTGTLTASPGRTLRPGT